MSDWLVDDSLAPATSGALAPLYEAAERGELALPHCGSCTEPLELEQSRCDRCGSTDVAWRTVAPTGTVHSVTTVHRRERSLIVADQPYHVVDVELASGHRLLMTTVGPTRDAPRIGDPAHVEFRHVGGVPLPALSTTDPTDPPLRPIAPTRTEVPQ